MPDMRPHFAQDLDLVAQEGCRNHDCTHEDQHSPMFFHSQCHPKEKKVEVCYLGGMLTLQCVVCGDVICNIPVKERNVDADAERRFMESCYEAFQQPHIMARIPRLLQEAFFKLRDAREDV